MTTPTYTPSSIRAAILRAADRVEREPSCYSFGAIKTPDCGTPACMIGWIGHELGAKPGLLVNAFMSELRTGIPTKSARGGHAEELYAICNQVSTNYQWDHKKAAAGMRAYADKYFPATAAPQLDPAYLSFRAGLGELGALTGEGVAS